MNSSDFVATLITRSVTGDISKEYRANDVPKRQSTMKQDTINTLVCVRKEETKMLYVQNILVNY